MSKDLVSKDLASKTMRTVASGRRSSSQPRLRAAENDALRSRHLAIKQILVCVDGTDRDRSVLDQALQIALRFDSHIDILLSLIHI